MSTGVSTDYGYTNSTAYQREQAAKTEESEGKVTYQSFLKLLTTQLSNQDPLNPMEDIDFTGQLAQLQALDEQMAMTKTMKSMRTDTQLQAGTAMIGKYVVGTDSTGVEGKGLVTRVVQNSDGVFVELANEQLIEVSSINNVWNDANSMNQDLAGSGYAINKWVEAGIDPETQQPIQGIVETVKMVNGQVVLKLYGGEEVTWDQVTELRTPTDAELIYALPAAVREKLQQAMKMVNKGVTGKDDDGNVVYGIVGGYDIIDGKVYVLLYTPEDWENPEAIQYDNITSGPRKPTAADAARSMDGLWVTGLDKDGKDLSGVVVGAEENNDGMALILDSGERVYFDTIKDIRQPEGAEQARMHGKYIEGTSTGGEEAGGVAIKKLEVGGKLAFLLHTGEIVLCENITGVRNATDEEAKAAAEVEDALEE